MFEQKHDLKWFELFYDILFIYILSYFSYIIKDYFLKIFNYNCNNYLYCTLYIYISKTN